MEPGMGMDKSEMELRDSSGMNLEIKIGIAPLSPNDATYINHKFYLRFFFASITFLRFYSKTTSLSYPPVRL